MNIITHAEWVNKMTCFIQEYVERKITAKVFQTKFLRWWPIAEAAQNEKEKAEYYIIHDLFYEVLEFCIYPHLREEGDINEKGLHKLSRLILKRLQEFEKTQDIEKVHRESETYYHNQRGSL